ncbi:sensor histidine kinase [Chitinophaga qingshengii]|uniref:Sensor histidine kinase n=1 Tax=Chitinophaga qingshengii TaxID=1569794 RepID=A0ABR7TRP2_9BACT|nr:sensor histidine kinase [Chitinophaga qingshengii]MBC9933157.1 sensor histidine kinase [Chitinophaga qingshengii]
MQPLSGLPLGLVKYRRRSILLYLLLLPLLSLAESEHPFADSLLLLLQHTTKREQKAAVLFQLSQYWADLDSARGVNYALQALEYNPHDAYHEGQGHYFLGSAFFDYDIPRAQQEFQQAIPLLQQDKKNEAVRLLSKAWHNYGVLEQRQGREKNFADILLNKVIPLAQQAGDTLYLGNYYLSLSSVFSNIFDYERSSIYAAKAAALFRQQPARKEFLIASYTTIAANYLSLQQTTAAKPYLDSAAVYIQQYPHSRLVPGYYGILGRYYNKIRAWPLALSSLRQGIQLADSINRQYDATTMSMDLYETYKAQGFMDTARQLLLDIYKRPYVREMPENMRLVLRELASTDSALHHPQQAYEWLLQYSSLTDTLTERQTRQQINELEAKYNYAEKEKVLLQLRGKAAQQKTLLWSVITLFILSGFVAVYFYRSRKNKVLQRQQIAVAKALLHGEETERTRLARDLHDGLGGTLASMKMRLAEATADPAAPLVRLSLQLDQAITELRRIAHNMMPEALLRLGLTAALEDLCEIHTTSRLKITLQTINIQPDLPLPIQLIVYRIVQELLTNACKHAGADEVLVQCSQLGPTFYITIEDNGKGFSPSHPDETKGIGLKNVRHRVEFLNGKMDIRSGTGAGTVINIELSCKSTTVYPS